MLSVLVEKLILIVIGIVSSLHYSKENFEPVLIDRTLIDVDHGFESESPPAGAGGIFYVTCKT